jgi:hypothetical protein
MFPFEKRLWFFIYLQFTEYEFVFVLMMFCIAQFGVFISWKQEAEKELDF